MKTSSCMPNEPNEPAIAAKRALADLPSWFPAVPDPQSSAPTSPPAQVPVGAGGPPIFELITRYQGVSCQGGR